MADVTKPILLDETGQEIVTALETIAENMGTSAGHTIQNDSGTDMQRRDKLQFKGVYVEDDQTNNKTVVNVTRQMTLAEFNQLTSEQKKGLIDVTDQQGHSITTDIIGTNDGTNLTTRINNIENGIYDASIDIVSFNTLNNTTDFEVSTGSVTRIICKKTISEIKQTYNITKNFIGATIWDNNANIIVGYSVRNNIINIMGTSSLDLTDSITIELLFK